MFLQCSLEFLQREYCSNVAFRQFCAGHENSSRMRLTLMAGMPLRRVFLLCSRTTIIGRPAKTVTRQHPTFADLVESCMNASHARPGT
jgi:hypothetical protein